MITVTHVGNRLLRTGGAERLFRKISAYLAERGRVRIRQSICVGSQHYDQDFCSTFPHPVTIGGKEQIQQAIDCGDMIITWGGVDFSSMGLKPHVCVYNVASEFMDNFNVSKSSVTHCIAACHSVARMVKEFDTTVVYPGIDSGDLSGGRCRDYVRRNLGLSEADLLVAMIGRIDKNKNQVMLVEAMRKIADPSVRAVFVGEGPEARALLKQAPNSCHFAGHSEQVGEWYRASDIVCILSRHECMPAALLESSFFGKPLISTLPGAVAEFLDDKNSWVAKDSDQLASAIMSARSLAQESLRLKGESLRFIYEAHGDYRETAAKWESLFVRLSNRMGMLC